MPRGDKTGPDGKGPKTGRGLGFCAGSETPGFQSTRGVGGRGMGRGMGAGRGFGRGMPVQNVELSTDEQVKVLEAERQAIEAKLKALKK